MISLFNGQSYLTVAIGCIGGKLRSVYMAGRISHPCKIGHDGRMPLPSRCNSVYIASHLR
ncbi:RapZ C-terminal domain-containing protein [Xenorhabdus khoisanae]|uniref:RapZ C-terminal domain-containing protein n=1 Tax=Xenorhabdus khoisanae TaxID=880157 RepID=UPI003B587105